MYSSSWNWKYSTCSALTVKPGAFAGEGSRASSQKASERIKQSRLGKSQHSGFFLKHHSMDYLEDPLKERVESSPSGSIFL